jgi:hypothetical protein
MQVRGLNNPAVDRISREVGAGTLVIADWRSMSEYGRGGRCGVRLEADDGVW